MIDSIPVTRPEKPDDWSAVAELHQLAFEQDDEAKLVERLRKHKDYDPELSLVAVYSGHIVGHIFFSPVAIESESGKVEALALAPMAVAPEYQSRGIGSKLLHQGLANCSRKGHKIVVVIGQPDFYSRSGFVPAKPLGLEASCPASDEDFMVLELTSGALKGVTGKVRYPEAFAGV